MGKVSLKDLGAGRPIGEDYSTSEGMVLRSEKSEVSRVTFKKEGGAEPHSHPEEQSLFVEEGRLEVTLGDGDDLETYVVEAGQGSFHPSNAVITLKALEDTRIVSFKNLVDGSGYEATGILQ
ncbi:MAG: cupin domain-containing protein [Acidimicrobiia bacterium]|nr:cupin domain-containing protein [Acidimicrobiia bacterium]